MPTIIFLYPSDPNPTTVILSDPTKVRSIVPSRIVPEFVIGTHIFSACRALKILIDSINATPENSSNVADVQKIMTNVTAAVRVVYMSAPVPFSPYTSLLIAVNKGLLAAQTAMTLTSDKDLIHQIELQYYRLLRGSNLLFDEIVDSRAPLTS